MKQRKLPLGTRNIIGGRVAELRTAKGIKQKDFISRLQTEDMDINPSSYSKLEGQTRQVTDIEIVKIAGALGVAIDELFG